jgi:long-chain acyl-CoA synthetase
MTEAAVAVAAAQAPTAPEVPTREATFPQLLRELAARHGDRRHALREKRYGIWQPQTWAGYERRVRDFACGLAAMGFERGETLAILGDNRPEWVIAELAAQSLAGRSVGLYPEGVLEEVEHVLAHAQVRFVVAEDQEQVDKLVELERAGRLPTVEHVVFYDPHGLERYEHPSLIEFTRVEERGRSYGDDHPGWWEEQVDRGRPDDVAILCTTSGTTGKPKLAMLSHRNLLSMGASLMSIDPIEADDEFLSFLPLAWIGEQMIAMACALQAGFPLNFPESAATQQTDLREIGPRVMFSPPRIWESLLSQVQVRVGDAGWLKRRAFGWGIDVGRRYATARLRGGKPSAALSALHLLAELVALRSVREQLGLTRIRRAYTGGAPLGPDVFEFFHAIGVNLKQIYGQTEICGIAVIHRDGDIKFNTVGTGIPGTELRIGEDGEIQLRSPAVFQGYYRNDEATVEALHDGWLHTGDAGYVDEDGHLVVIDRAKDVLQAPDGTRFSPAFIENKLKFSPHVMEAVSFGGGDRPYVAALICIDADNVGTWAERARLGYTTYTDLAQKPEVYDLVAEHVQRANQDLPEGARVKRFLLLHKQLDPDDEEMTRTRKVRRGVIGQRYGDIIESLYADVDEVTIRSVITYQDGTRVERPITLRIRSMDRSGGPGLRDDNPRPRSSA